MKYLRSNNFTYQVAIERIVTKLNQGKTPNGFKTTSQFITWFNHAPNYKRAIIGLDYKL